MKNKSMKYLIFQYCSLIIGFIGFILHMYPEEAILPTMLLFTGYREYTKSLWLRNVKIDTRVTYQIQKIPEIQGIEYNHKILQKATENWKRPVVVRGLFTNTSAIRNWQKQDYLPKQFGDISIPVVGDARNDNNQNNRTTMKFDESFNEVFSNDQSNLYLFFPVLSRFSFNGSEAGKAIELQERVNQVILEDLEIDKLIWKGFGKHKTYKGSQFVIGRGRKDQSHTTGSNFHCAIGNNYFIQAVGRKRWYFLDPKYSRFLHPLRGGIMNMWTSNPTIHESHDHLPLQFVDLEPGDMLYNPDWTWHTVFNYEGLSIGIPVRESNISIAFQNNFIYTSIVMWNILANRLGIDIGGYPLLQKED